jgi:hypothetical protein
MKRKEAGGLAQLHDGRYTVPCEYEGSCPLLTLDSVAFGSIDGLPKTTALVVLTYHSGGTATWQYIYVISLKDGKPEVVTWIETRSRADAGLRSVQADHGNLLLVVNDPEKRFGDCCSTGSIAHRYKWNRDSFVEAVVPIKTDDPQ